MAYGRTNYSATQVAVNKKRYSSSDKRRLGNRTLFTDLVDNKKYYSSLDAEIHFGETYIDEITQISWAVEQATMPLYGYNSYTFDDIAIGARQITGSFVINFTKSGFLYDVLQNVQPVNRSAYYVQENLDDNSNLRWSSNYDKEHKSSWNRNFNIRVGYGDYASNPDNNTMIVLHCVQITGCQQMIGIDGSPIAEIYSFIAKDIRYELNLPDNNANISSSSSNNNSDEKTKEFLFSMSNWSLKKAEEGRKSVYKFAMDYSYSGGTIDKIYLNLKTNTNVIINSTGIEIDVNSKNSSVCTIPDAYTSALNVAFNNNGYVYATIEVRYKVNDKEGTKYIRNRKIELSS